MLDTTVEIIGCQPIDFSNPEGFVPMKPHSSFKDGSEHDFGETCVVAPLRNEESVDVAQETVDAGVEQARV